MIEKAALASAVVASLSHRIGPLAQHALADALRDMVDDHRVVTVEEASALTGLSRKTLERSDLPRVQLSARRVGYRMSDLRGWVAGRMR